MKFFHHTLRITRFSLFAALVLLALSLSLVRLWLLPGIDKTRHYWEEQLTDALGVPLHIQHLRARLNGLDPELRLIGVALDTEAGKRVLFKEIQIVLDTWASLRQGEVKPSLIRILGAHLEIQRTAEGRFRILGMPRSQADSDLSFGEGRYEILHSHLTWHNLQRNAPPIELDNVSLRLDNQADRHRLQVFFDGAGLGAGLVTFDARFSGQLLTPSSWRGQFYANLQGLQLTEIGKILENSLNTATNAGAPSIANLLDHFDCRRGNGDVRLWGEWQNHTLHWVGGVAKLTHLQFGKRPDSIDISALSTWFRWGPLAGGGQKLELGELKILIDPQFSSSHLSLSLTLNKNQNSLDLAGHHIDLTRLNPLFHLFATTPGFEGFKPYQAISANGRLHHFILAWRQQPEQADHLSICGRFDRLGIAFASNSDWPRIQNLTGLVCGDNRQGDLLLDSHHSELTLASQLSKPITLTSLTGTIQWRHQAQRWQIASSNLHLSNFDFDSNLRFAIAWQANSSPWLNAVAVIPRLNLANLHQYLPLKTPKSLAAWFARSPLHGIAAGKLLWHGKLDEFPYRDHNGVSEGYLKVNQPVVKYLESWPEISGNKGNVRFINGRLDIDLPQSRIAGAKITELHGEIEDIEQSPHFHIFGKSSESITKILAVLENSPLQKPVASLLQWSDLIGKADLSIVIEIPLSQGNHFNLQGQARLDNTTLALSSSQLALKKLAGDLTFSDQHLQAQLAGEFASRPAQLSLFTEKRKTHAQLQTRIDAPWLANAFGFQVQPHLAGETGVLTTLEIDHNQSLPPRLRFNSDLIGLAVNLPDPVGKSPDSSRPLQIIRWLDHQSSHPITVDYGAIHASLLVNDKWVPVSGRIGIHQPPPKPRMDQRGWLVAGRLPRLSLDDWRKSIQSVGGNRSKIYLQAIDLTTDHLISWGKDWGSISLSAQHFNQNWEGSIASAAAEGSWHYSQSENALIARLNRLDLDPLGALSAPGPTAAVAVKPKDVPELSITTRHLLWRQHDLGAFRLHAFRRPEQLAFELRSDAKSFKLEAQGTWHASAKTQQTRLYGGFRSKNFGKFLQRLGHPTAIAETPAKIDFEVQWPGAPYQYTLADLKGRLQVKFGKGRWLDIEPGAGRLLGLLYLGTLQRRLKFDFSDLFQSGLFYDRITGDIALANGIAQTDNLLIESVPARIFVTGEVDLIDHQVDELVTVVPNTPLTLGLLKQRPDSELGRAAGLAQRAFNAPLDSLTQSQYAISGTWDDPIITRVRRSLPGSVWHGIWSSLKEMTGTKPTNDD